MQLQYEISLPEFMEMAWVRHRSSIRWLVGICIGATGLVLGGVFSIYVDAGIGIFLASVSALLVLMQLVIPSLVFRRVYRRNSRMFGPRTVTVNERGITSEHQLGRSESSWNTYQKFQETQRSFLLYQSADLIGILPKRAFATSAELEQFRAFLVANVSPSTFKPSDGIHR